MRAIDLHMHTRVSDGTDRPEEIIGKVREAGIGVFSVTDHDSIDCASIIPGLLKKGDPVFISGVEFFCKDEEGKCHMLGYGYDPESESIRHIVEMGHNFRMDTARRRVLFLKETFGFVFPEEEEKKFFALDNPGKPHLANLMVKLGMAVNKKQAIEDYINKMPNRDNYVRPKEAIEGILGAGGIPVLAHPFFGSGNSHFSVSDLRRKVERLMGFGLQGIEGFYSGFDDDLIREALKMADELGLYVTAGSDYHGRNKTVVLGDTGLPRWSGNEQATRPNDGLDDSPDGGSDGCGAGFESGIPALERFLSDVRRIEVQ